MKLNYILSGLLAVSLLSCTTTNTSSEEKHGRVQMIGIQGMSFSHINSEWGKADSTLDNPDGTKTLIYKGVKTTIEDPLTEKEQVHSCEVKIILNRHEIVEDWDNVKCNPPLKSHAE